MGAQRHRRGPDPADVEAARRRAEASAATERRIAERFARLHATTAALSAALTPSEVAAAIASRGAVLPGASGCAVALPLDGGALAVAVARGASERLVGPLPIVPADADLPLATAARERRPVFAAGDGGTALDLVAPSLPLRSEVLPAVAALPLLAGDRLLAVVAVALEPHALDEEERAFLEAFAHACAQALERARLYEAERVARLEAQRAEEAARRAVELQEQLAGIVGHDLRTPLAAIRMSTAVLFKRGGLTDEQARTLARIGASAARMSRIIRDLLDFTRERKEGGIPIAARPGDLAAMVRQGVAELAAVHPDRDIRLEAPASAPVIADPDRIGQVVANLVGNAIQHGPPEGPVTVRVEPGEGGTVLLRVHNAGPPIPAALLPHVFEPFRRAGAGEEGGSLGLGLFIVRQLVHAHGGRVEVRSSAEEGTTFTVRLPTGDPAAAGASTGGLSPGR